MDNNGVFIAAHISMVFLMFCHVYLNIYEIDKLTHLHEKKRINIGIFKYLFPSYKLSNEEGIFVKTFIKQLIVIVLFILMTIFMIISLFHLFRVKVITLVANFVVSIVLVIYTTVVKNKYKKII